MKQILPLFLLCITTVCYAQTKTKKVSVKWGTEEKANRRLTLSDIIGYDESGIYVLKVSTSSFNNDIFIEHYDNNLSKTKAEAYNFSKHKPQRQFEFAVHLNGTLSIFSTELDSKDEKKRLFVQNLNKKNLQPGKDKLVASIPLNNKSKRKSSFNYHISSDSTKFMIFCQFPDEKNEGEIFEVKVFDEALNPLWNKKIQLPYNSKLFDIERFRVDNKGDVYLLAKIMDEKKERVKGKPSHNFDLLYYSSDGTEQEIPVRLNNRFINDLQFTSTKDGKIICSGFYSDHNNTTSIAGTYYLKVDRDTKTTEIERYKEFPLDFLTLNMTERQAAKTEKKAAKGKDIELYKLKLEDMIVRKDGGIYLIGEQYFVNVVTFTTTDANGRTTTRTTHYYHFNDIIVVNINPEGEIEWAEKIPKKQITTNDNGFFSSYAKAMIKDNLYFIFNDHAKNLYYNGVGHIENFRRDSKSVVMLVEVTQEGRTSKELLFTAKDANVLTRPLVCEQISPNRMIIFGQKQKSHKFANLSF